MVKQKVYQNPSVNFLLKKIIEKKETILSKEGGVIVYTGKYTGRSPNDRFIVDTPFIHQKIDWGKVNIPISSDNYQRLYKKMIDFFNTQQEYYVVDCLVGAEKKSAVKLRVYSEYAYEALFATHMFRKPNKKDLKNFKPNLNLYVAPSVYADPAIDGTNSEAFIILNFNEKVILIGTTKYLGEIKKSVFSYMNYLLPQKRVLPMHYSANIEKGSDKKNKVTALFFGLSGTGKTTLSADPQRQLIGDDEHGWGEKGIFNFEGGCYAKCIRLNKDSEPQIWKAVHKKGAVLENIALTKDHQLDFDSDYYTENTRAAYPLSFIANSVKSGLGGHPKYVIFLTADASGVLPPVAKLTLDQAAYHFLSGYTSKLAGTERGVVEPKATFSAFFGAPFMPLKPMVYLNLFKDYLKKHKTQVYLVNTGWIGGPYGVGHRIPIKETRAIVSAILNGQLDKGDYRHDKIFNLFVPKNIVGVNSNILDPSFSWENKSYYIKKAKELASLFIENIKRYSGIDKSIISSGPFPV